MRKTINIPQESSFQVVKKNNGILSVKEAEKYSVTRAQLALSVKQGSLVRLERGVYALPDTPDDELYQMQVHCKKGIYSHETALYLLGYTDRVPFQYTMTVPKGYHPAAVSEGFVLVGTKRELYEDGICSVKTIYGNEVKCYCIEKTLCDLMREKYQCDIQELLPAFKKYMKSKKRNLIVLMKFSEALHVAKKMRNWMEVYT